MMADSKPVIEMSRRSIAAGLLTGVCLLSAVVFARRTIGAGSDLASPAMACGIAAVVMLVGAWSVLSILTRTLDHTSRWLSCGLACLPGLMLGLALVPAGSSVALFALIAVAVLVTLSGTFASSTFGLDAHVPEIREAPTPAVTSTDHAPVRADSTDSHVANSTHSPVQAFENAAQPMSEFELKLLAEADRRTVLSARGTNSKDGHASQVESDFTEQEFDESEHCESELSEAGFEPDDESDVDAAADDVNLETLHPSVDPRVCQWLTRGEAAGQETCEGGIRVRFEPRSKLVAVHVPFTPPFATVPQFDVEPLEDVDIEIRITGVHAYGVRFEVTRRTQLDRELITQVGYCATAVASSLASSHRRSQQTDAVLRSA